MFTYLLLLQIIKTASCCKWVATAMGRGFDDLYLSPSLSWSASSVTCPMKCNHINISTTTKKGCEPHFEMTNLCQFKMKIMRKNCLEQSKFARCILEVSLAGNSSAALGANLESNSIQQREGERFSHCLPIALTPCNHLSPAVCLYWIDFRKILEKYPNTKKDSKFRVQDLHKIVNQVDYKNT